MVEKPTLYRQTPAEAAEATIGAYHPMTGHEQRARVARTCLGGRPDSCRTPGPRGELTLGDRRTRPHLPQHGPRVRDELAAALANRHGVDGGKISIEVGLRGLGQLTEILLPLRVYARSQFLQVGRPAAGDRGVVARDDR